jgi:hypothetical protein
MLCAVLLILVPTFHTSAGHIPGRTMLPTNARGQGRKSSEPTVLSYKVVVFLRLFTIANLMMSSSTEYDCYLETGRKGSLYRLYKLRTMPQRLDPSATTYLISTIESFLRVESKSSTVFSSTTVSNTFFSVGEYVCVQIVAPKETITKEKCMYWAEGSGLVTGTVVLSKNKELLYDEASTYGNFKHDIYGTYSRTSLRDHTNNLPFRTSRGNA